MPLAASDRVTVSKKGSFLTLASVYTATRVMPCALACAPASFRQPAPNTMREASMTKASSPSGVLAKYWWQQPMLSSGSDIHQRMVAPARRAGGIGAAAEFESWACHPMLAYRAMYPWSFAYADIYLSLFSNAYVR